MEKQLTLISMRTCRNNALILMLFTAVMAAQTAPAAGEDAKRAVAAVNGSPITQQELDAAIDRLIPEITYHRAVTEDKKSEFREKALEGLIDYELKYQDAVNAGMKPDRKLVKEQWNAVRDQFPSKKEYRKALETAGLSEDEWNARIEKRVLVDQMTRKVVIEPAQMSDEAVKSYYDKNTEKFMQPESVRFRYITVKEEKKIQEAYKQVQSGKDFAMVASRMSEDDYRVKGGDRGFMHKGGMVPEMENIVFAMKPGEVAGPFQAAGTWVLVKMEEKRPGRQIAYEETREKLKNELVAKRTQDLMEKWIAGLRSKAKIEIYAKERSEPK